jgi:general secretion pathway protein J
LLEMLVALVVFGLLLAGLSQTTHFALTAWRMNTKNAAGPARVSAVDTALRRLIEQASPQDFAGASDNLAFTTMLPEGSRVTGRADAAIFVTPGQNLVLRWAPHPAGKLFGLPPPPHSEMLLPDVAAIRFSYLTLQPNGAPVWVSSWQRPGLPLLVRIGIQFTGPVIWPDFLAAPIATGP